MKIYFKKIVTGIMWIACYLLISFVASIALVVVSNIIIELSNQAFGSIALFGLPYFITWFLVCNRRKNNNVNRRNFLEQNRSVSGHPLKVILSVGNFKIDLLASYTIIFPVVVLWGLNIESSVVAFFAGVIMSLLCFSIYILSDLLCWFLVMRDWKKTICSEE